MKRDYILFQVILIVVGLTFYSCSVETESLSTEQAYDELKLPEDRTVCKSDQSSRPHVFGVLPSIITRLSLPVLSMRLLNISVY